MLKDIQRHGAPRLDWSIYSPEVGIVYQTQSANSEVAIKATIKIINSLPGFEIKKSVCCMEHTGIYNAHFHARKRLKSLLHLAAMSAIRVKGGIQNYYFRKVAEDKNKMLVLNAVRNKLIHRVCAVVHNQKKYDENYTATLV